MVDISFGLVAIALERIRGDWEFYPFSFFVIWG
jgi:hypothetical protein